ncbi:WRKY domain [Dillenia turbinata]|uniref:WRKY domain n=1 Tax=Dillenia turbinata TaxID=194707 RepID=A0AAN8V5T8_9MAGN
MAENDDVSRGISTSSGLPSKPTITLPQRSSMESIFNGGLGVSPGPMTLVSSFFAENDPDTDCRSFSQLLAGAMDSPSAVSVSVRRSGEMNPLDQNRPSDLVIPSQSQSQCQSQSPMVTIPPGLSPTGLLYSPVWFSSAPLLISTLLFFICKNPFGMSHQQALEQITAQASKVQAHMNMQPEYTSSSVPPTTSMLFPSFSANAPGHQQRPPMEDSSEPSNADQGFQPSSMTVDKPADDGYNWRKYGQKQVKGSEYPRSYYKCTHPNCPVKKKVERSLDGQITEIIYKGQHNHQPPQPNKRAKDGGNPNGDVNYQENHEFVSTGELNRSNEVMSTYSNAKRDRESSQATTERMSGSSASEDGDNDSRVDGKEEDEPDAKRRNTVIRTSEATSSQRTVTEPRIIVQTTSEVDLLDDGYRWRKYGQKVVKGNPYPRSYYKCTTQGCSVRKHVERAASDPKAVITTYEGKHNHEVPAARNSSHNTAPGNTSQLRVNNGAADQHSCDQQRVRLLRLKEEQR